MRLHEVVRNFMSEREEPDNAMRNGVIWYNEIIPTMRYKRWKDCLSARQRHLWRSWSDRHWNEYKIYELTPCFVISKVQEETSITVERDHLRSEVIEDMETGWWKFVHLRKRLDDVNETSQRIVFVGHERPRLGYVSGHVKLDISHLSYWKCISWQQELRKTSHVPIKSRSPARPEISQYPSSSDSFTICIWSLFRTRWPCSCVQALMAWVIFNAVGSLNYTKIYKNRWKTGLYCSVE